MKTTTKEKQVVINVSEEAKEQFKSIKERFSVTDKDLMDFLLDMFTNTKQEELNASMVAFTLAKKKAKVDKKIARYMERHAAKLKQLREAVGEQDAETTTDESVESDTTVTQ